MATYVNDLRLKEIATGDSAGTWGTETNVNLELIAEAMGHGTEAIANASTHTITMADGVSDGFRSTFLRLTGGGQACTVTLAPNTLSHTWVMRNETSYTLTFTQGSGANVNISSGQTKIVATNGGGSGAIVYEMDDLELAGNLVVGGTLGVTGVLTGTSLDISGDIDIDGTANLDIVDIDGAVNMATTALVTGVLTTTATQVATGGITSGSDIISDTDSTDSLGSTGVRWLKGWFDTLTAGTLTIGSGSVTDSSGAISFGNENLTTTGIVTAAGTSVFTNLDISGDVDIDGTANLDIVDVDGAVNFAADVTFADGADIITASAGTSNFRAGVNAGNSIASGGNYNVAVGDEAGTAITTGDENVFVGFKAGFGTTTASQNIAIGSGALETNILGSHNIGIGNGALATANQGSLASVYNTCVGSSAGNAISTGTNNTFVGGLCGDGTNDGTHNTAIGKSALSANCADSNTAVGASAGAAVTGSSNTLMGEAAGVAVSSGSNNCILGSNAGRTGGPGGNITTASNTISLGNESVATANIQVDWTVASDARDKTDFIALDLGLDFVKALAPVTYKWDKRSNYGDKTADDYDLTSQTPDGTHKEDWLDIGFKAQEVEALEIAAGYNKDSNTNLVSSHTGDGKQMGLQYSKFVPILVKAIQEQNALIESLTARITTLEG